MPLRRDTPAPDRRTAGAFEGNVSGRTRALSVPWARTGGPPSSGRKLNKMLNKLIIYLISHYSKLEFSIINIYSIIIYI